jgi:putative transposase
MMLWGNWVMRNGTIENGRKYRMLNVLDEFTHECLAIRVAHKLKAIDVAENLL